jgi:DnaJ-class molecular chaperone
MIKPQIKRICAPCGGTGRIYSQARKFARCKQCKGKGSYIVTPEPAKTINIITQTKDGLRDKEIV